MYIFWRLTKRHLVFCSHPLKEILARKKDSQRWQKISSPKMSKDQWVIQYRKKERVRKREYNHFYDRIITFGFGEEERAPISSIKQARKRRKKRYVFSESTSLLSDTDWDKDRKIEHDIHRLCPSTTTLGFESVYKRREWEKRRTNPSPLGSLVYFIHCTGFVIDLTRLNSSRFLRCHFRRHHRIRQEKSNNQFIGAHHDSCILKREKFSRVTDPSSRGSYWNLPNQMC